MDCDCVLQMAQTFLNFHDKDIYKTNKTKNIQGLQIDILCIFMSFLYFKKGQKIMKISLRK